MPTMHHYVRVHVCTSSIQWEIQSNPYQSSETTTCNTNVTAPLKPQETNKLRVAWEVMGSTRARLANTAKRAPNMLTHHHHVRVHVCSTALAREWSILRPKGAEREVVRYICEALAKVKKKILNWKMPSYSEIWIL